MTGAAAARPRARPLAFLGLPASMSPRSVPTRGGAAQPAASCRSHQPARLARRSCVCWVVVWKILKLKVG